MRPVWRVPELLRKASVPYELGLNTNTLSGIERR